jgi:hypothetical protein
MPINLIVYGVIALAVFAGIGYGYHTVKKSGYDEAKAECVAAGVAQAKREKDASDKAAADLAAERAKRKVVIQTRTSYVDREVEKPVYRNVCLPDSGVSCVNAAINGTDATGCKPAGTVPPVKPTG